MSIQIEDDWVEPLGRRPHGHSEKGGPMGFGIWYCVPQQAPPHQHLW